MKTSLILLTTLFLGTSLYATTDETAMRKGELLKLTGNKISIGDSALVPEITHEPDYKAVLDTI